MRMRRSGRAWLVPAVVLPVVLLPIGCYTIYPRDVPGFVSGYPSGPDSGVVGETLRYEVCAIDVYGQDVCYQPDWGDTSRLVWTAPYASGLPVSFPHSYADTGTCRVRFKARALGKYESDWSDSIVVRIASQSR